MKTKFYLDKLEGVINYYDIQKDYLVEDGNGELVSFNFGALDQIGIDEDNYPSNLSDFKKLGIDLEEEVIICNDLYEEYNVFYFFNQKFNCITIDSDKYTMKEAMTIINIVMEQQRIDKKWCYEVSIGLSTDRDHFTLYHQESTAYGLWWNDFIKLFQENQDKIDSISIDLATDEHKIIIELHIKEDE